MIEPKRLRLLQYAAELALLCAMVCSVPQICAADDQKAPTTFAELWSGVDINKEPLDVEVVSQWEETSPDGRRKIVVKKIIYTVGTFKGKKSRIAAFYALPKGAKKLSLAGVLHLHGGGQRAFLREVRYYAGAGYAALSINWGGKPMEDEKAGAKKPAPNTDWGAVNPTQTNVLGYFNFKPGELYLDSQASPRNNNWYLLTLAARRGIKFLYDQIEVQPGRIGVYGLSMGGNLTMYTAGTEPRVKVAVAEVGGSGYRTFKREFLPAYRPRDYGEHTELYRKTMSFQAYAPHIKAPLLYLSATNDFHGLMDDCYRTGALVPDQSKMRYSFAPHRNHRFTPEFIITERLWLDQYLRPEIKRVKMPTTVAVKWVGRNEHGDLQAMVLPDAKIKPVKINFYYSTDSDPRSRFWRWTEALTSANPAEKNPVARLMLLRLDQPVYVFANLYYKLEEPLKDKLGIPVDQFAFSSQMRRITPRELADWKIKANDKPSLVIEEFKNDWRDWYVLNRGNPTYWQYWTRKVTDEKWRGPKDATLELQIRSAKPNKLVISVIENEWRNYRGKRREFAAVVDLAGGKDVQTVRLAASDFQEVGQRPNDKKQRQRIHPQWDQLDRLGILGRYHAGKGEQRVELGGKWQGDQPEFRLLRWVDSDAER